VVDRARDVSGRLMVGDSRRNRVDDDTPRRNIGQLTWNAVCVLVEVVSSRVEHGVGQDEMIRSVGLQVRQVNPVGPIFQVADTERDDRSQGTTNLKVRDIKRGEINGMCERYVYKIDALRCRLWRPCSQERRQDSLDDVNGSWLSWSVLGIAGVAARVRCDGGCVETL